MNKRAAIFSGVVSLLIVTNILAGGWENNTNASAEFVQAPCRNASTDADAAYFNPAAIAGFNDGIFMNIDNQFINKNYSDLSAATGQKYTDSKPVLLLPNLQLGYKKDSWGAFLTFNVPAGGGSVLYDKGSATTGALIGGLTGALAAGIHGTTTIADQNVESSSAYYGITLGGATAVTDYLSLGAAGRMVLARNSTSLDARFGVSDPSGQLTSNWDMSANYDESANGFTGLVSADITPIKNLLVALKYEFVTRLQFEQKNVVSSATMTNSAAMTATLPPTQLATLAAYTQGAVAGLAAEGAKYNNDLPAFLAAGVSYKFIPALETSVGVNYYFNKQARWNLVPGETIDNSLDLSAGARYDILPKLQLCAGYEYCKAGSNGNYFGVPENPALNYNTVGVGASVTVRPDVLFNLGVANTFYTELHGQSAATGPLTLDKKLFDVALGVSYFPGNKR